MIVLDAGVLIGLLDDGDAHHHAALSVLEAQSPPYLVHTLTLAEVLVGPARTGVAEAVWHDLRDVGVTIADMGADEPLLLARLRAEHRLKMPDTCVLAVAVEHGVPLLSFDRQLAAVADRLGVRHRTDADPPQSSRTHDAVTRRPVQPMSDS